MGAGFLTEHTDCPRERPRARRRALPSEPDPSEVYIAVRAHELMLNEATAAQERTVVPPLLTLNGGAAVAFLTLLGALGEDAQFSVEVTLAAWAIGAWMVGLLLAATAQWAAA